MLFTEFHGEKLPMLGFGTLRLPTTEDGKIYETQVREMVKYAIEHGVNYFDTAYPYHNGDAERVVGRVLRDYPRNSYYLATKYPGYQIMSKGYNPAEIFEEQLLKCGVDYFDFYLLHNIYENSISTYFDPRWGIIEYFKEQKKLGRIKHLGFSTHAQLSGLEEILDRCGDDMEFCQIQLNYLDWTLQAAKEKYDLLTKRGIPIWVMEPVRGGKLANLSSEDEAKLKALRPHETVASWGFRFLQELPGVQMVLSGMSNMEQMRDNVKTFSARNQLTKKEINTLLDIAEGMKDSVPCTGCRYCCDGCPQGLNIPVLLGVYNEIRIVPNINATMYIELLDDSKKPSACIACGKCTQVCPQSIDIPAEMKEFSKKLSELPSWRKICLEREATAKK